MDWGPLATIDNYFTACFNTPRVGCYAGKELVVDILVRALGQDPDKIHVIGHSLGAHVAGHLGRTVQEYLSLKIGRITGLYKSHFSIRYLGKQCVHAGLDPGKPWIDNMGPDAKVLPTDADFVDIMHTNSGLIFDGELSFPEPLGHADFYPNGGSHQPGCTSICLDLDCIILDLIDFLLGNLI